MQRFTRSRRASRRHAFGHKAARTKAQHKRKGAQAVDDSRNTTAENTNNAGEMSEFEKLMQKIADMPAEEQEKIAFFVSGYIAAHESEGVTWRITRHKNTEAATA